MPDWSRNDADAFHNFDCWHAGSIVMHAYVQLPLLPRRPDGSWVAPLKRMGDREFRLVESVAASPEQTVLRVEMLDRRTQSVIESRDCAEVEDAIEAFHEMAGSRSFS